MERLTERVRNALDGELSVSRLASLVLGDRAQHRACLAQDALLLPVGERR